MIEELYRQDENGNYIHSLLERNSFYGVLGEPRNGLKMEGADNYEQEN